MPVSSSAPPRATHPVQSVTVERPLRRRAERQERAERRRAARDDGVSRPRPRRGRSGGRSAGRAPRSSATPASAPARRDSGRQRPASGPSLAEREPDERRASQFSATSSSSTGTPRTAHVQRRGRASRPGSALPASATVPPAPRRLEISPGERLEKSDRQWSFAIAAAGRPSTVGESTVVPGPGHARRPPEDRIGADAGGERLVAAERSAAWSGSTSWRPSVSEKSSGTAKAASSRAPSSSVAAVADREEREPDADEQEADGRNRPGGRPGEREEREVERGRGSARQPLAETHRRTEQPSGGDRGDEADERRAAGCRGAGCRDERSGARLRRC